MPKVTVIETRLTFDTKKMGKRLRKATQGTASIKSFFTPINAKKEDPEASKSSNSDADSEVISTDPESDSDWEEKVKSKRKRARKSANNKTTKEEKNGKKSQKKETTKPARKSASVEVEVIKIVDEEKAAFLRSGIPTATAKAKQLNDVKREEEEATKFFQFFPKITHVTQLSEADASSPDHSIWSDSLGLKLTEESKLVAPVEASTDNFQCLESVDTVVEEICCGLSTFKGVKCKEEKSNENLPWVEKHGVLEKSGLTIDPECLDKVETWLRRWKRDIKGDNGKYRKILEKIKKKGNDSDFVTSDEDTEFQTTGLLLYGPTGTGKTATINTLARKMGFKVVEVNFSTARSGKDVLKRVEEATLSHRLEANQTCLLLFEDICLIEPKEDEGFGAAVAQLITSSRRPIVMTMTTNEPATVGSDCDYLAPDSKIEKKGYMPVYFPYQLPSLVVEKALLPIVKLEVSEEDEDSVLPLISSVARHCKGDIRKSINQLQLFLSSSNPIQKFHSHLTHFTDLNFIRTGTNRNNASRSYRRIKPSPDTKEVTSTDSKPEPKTRCQVEKELRALRDVANQLAFAVHSDRVNHIFDQRLCISSVCDDDFKTGRSHALRFCFDDCLNRSCQYFTSEQSETPDSGLAELESEEEDTKKKSFKLSDLLFESEDDLLRDRKVQSLSNELEQYCGTIGDFMSCGQFNYENFAYFRTIVKCNRLKALTAQKRHSRVNYYFNRVSNDLVEQVVHTFDFQNELKRAKCLQLG